MNTEFRVSAATITQAGIDAVIEQARADRAEVVRAMAVRLSALFSRLVARIRPSRGHLPQTGAWAR